MNLDEIDPIDRLLPVEREVFAALRLEGWAIVAFSPDEVDDADPRQVESLLTERGNAILDELNKDN